MLVLSRRVGERIVIDDEIVICVVEICADRVRLGVEAPQHVTVHREEVWEEIRRESSAVESEMDRLFA
jgi:carbon storage regulator